MRRGGVEEGNPHGVPHRKLPRGVRQEGPVLEGPHRVHPRLAGAVDEAAVDPRRHAVSLTLPKQRSQIHQVTKNTHTNSQRQGKTKILHRDRGKQKYYTERGKNHSYREKQIIEREKKQSH